MTDLRSDTKGLKDAYDIRIFGLTGPRKDIYAAADARVDRMFEEGVVGEAKRLERKGLSKTSRAVLGLKEIAGYLDGSYGLATAKELMKMNTRRFAKRQLTWFRADKRITWFGTDRLSPAKIAGRITRQVKG
jgi:tRNA dimethylallyltransferase